MRVGLDFLHVHQRSNKCLRVVETPKRAVVVIWFTGREVLDCHVTSSIFPFY